MKIFLISLLLIFSAPAFAADEKKYDCAVEKQKIFKDLKKDVQCAQDDECGYFDYGYPWQPKQCFKAIVNTKNESHNITNLRLIEEYNEHCIYPSVDEKKKYDEFAKSLGEASCDLVRTYCYKGFCRIKSYAIYDNK